MIGTYFDLLLVPVETQFYTIEHVSCFLWGLLACLLFPLMPDDKPSLVWEWMAEGGWGGGDSVDA